MRTIRTSVVVVGGGISGLACLRALTRAGIATHLLTDRFGGRMHHLREGGVTFSPIYVNDDYQNVLQFVDRGPRIEPEHAYRLSECGEFTPLLGPSFSADSADVVELIAVLSQLRSELSEFRRISMRESQKEAVGRFPLISRLANESGLDFLGSRNLQSLYRTCIEPVCWASAFVDPKSVSALYMLGALLPLVVPSYSADFRQTYARLESGVSRQIHQVRVQSVRRDRGKFTVATSSDEWSADFVVVATPPHNAKDLIGLTVRQAVASCDVRYVRGQLRAGANAPRRFAAVSNGFVVWRYQPDVDVVLSTRCDNEYLASVYENFRTVEVVRWKTALVLPCSTDLWLPSQIEKNLFLVGNYNMPTLEDCFASGVYAASSISDALKKGGGVGLAGARA